MEVLRTNIDVSQFAGFLSHCDRFGMFARTERQMSLHLLVLNNYREEERRVLVLEKLLSALCNDASEFGDRFITEQTLDIVVTLETLCARNALENICVA